MVDMYASSNDLSALRVRIDQIRACNRQLRQDLEAEFARFPRPARAPVTQPPAERKLNDLTPRELEVLRMIAQGCSTKELAGQLGIAFKTAACHRHRLMQKLEVHTASSLVRIAISAGLVEV
jgi:DNA-binding NarL/FixJ family response regulator